MRVIVGDGDPSQSQHTEEGIPIGQGQGASHRPGSADVDAFYSVALVSFHTEGQRRNADRVCCSQESAMSRAQSPPVPARKNQLRAEGRQCTALYRIFTSSSHPKVITELQELAKTEGKVLCLLSPSPIASCTNYSGTLYRERLSRFSPV